MLLLGRWGITTGRDMNGADNVLFWDPDSHYIGVFGL